VVREPEVGQAVEGDAAEAEDQVARVDRLGHAVDRPQGGPVAALDVTVLDVVVDEAEVVAQLHGGGARQRPGVLARDRRVGEQAQQRPHALAARSGRSVQAQVVADHLVHAGGRWVTVPDDAEDLRLSVGEQLVEVEIGRHGHGGSECSGSRR
jgi:hypothetical protein